MEKNFWVIEVHTGKMQKLARVSSNLRNVVCSKNSIVEHSSLFLFHLWAMLCGKYTKRELIHVDITTLFHYFMQDTKKQ